jgi:hypothetical protein
MRRYRLPGAANSPESPAGELFFLIVFIIVTAHRGASAQGN